MPCQVPYRDDSAQLLLFKIASCIEAGGGGSGGVISFNSRTGAVTLNSGDVTGALGFTPLSQTTGDARYVLKTGDTMSGLLTINTAATSLQTITSDAGVANTPETIQIYHRTSGVPAVGFGNRLQWYANTNGGTDQLQARIDAQWTDAADATRSSRLVFGTRNTGGIISSPLILTNGQLQMLDGLATIPSLSFQSDTDTGIYRIGANSLGISAGGVLRLTVDGTSTTSVGTILAPDGTAALPSHSFSADPDTGIYRIGANILGFSTAGVLAVTINASGNVGIGTAVPNDILNIVKTSNGGLTMDNYATNTSRATFLMRKARGSEASPSAVSVGDYLGIIDFVGRASSAYSVGAEIISQVTAAGGSVYANLQFGTRDINSGIFTTRMLIDDSGNVGIGTITPSSALTLGAGLALAFNSGANQRAGDAVLVAGTKTVANTAVTANTRIYLTRKVAGGTIGFAVTYTVIAATSFTITSDSALDTSTYSYLLIEVP